eukprot:1152182-Pelagomonas_calceolata.AAC.8
MITRVPWSEFPLQLKKTFKLGSRLHGTDMCANNSISCKPFAMRDHCHAHFTDLAAHSIFFFAFPVLDHGSKPTNEQECPHQTLTCKKRCSAQGEQQGMNKRQRHYLHGCACKCRPHGCARMRLDSSF